MRVAADVLSGYCRSRSLCVWLMASFVGGAAALSWSRSGSVLRRDGGMASQCVAIIGWRALPTDSDCGFSSAWRPSPGGSFRGSSDDASGHGETDSPRSTTGCLPARRIRSESVAGLRRNTQTHWCAPESSHGAQFAARAKDELKGRRPETPDNSDGVTSLRPHLRRLRPPRSLPHRFRSSFRSSSLAALTLPPRRRPYSPPWCR